MLNSNDSSLLILKALAFAAEKHKHQRRKGVNKTPYINHPIQVARVIAEVGQVSDLPTLLAAILHDTVEDTHTTPEELEKLFGTEVKDLVLEVSDDKTLSVETRKKLQVEKAAHKSEKAKHIKIADKSCNVRDMFQSPPDWPLKRKLDYLSWAKQVVDQIRGTNSSLENFFDETYQEGLAVLNSKTI